LPLILILDQFSRTIYRGTAQAFAQDEKACALAILGIELGHYTDLANGQLVHTRSLPPNLAQFIA
jgi:uncharacterized protein (DUF924 family)